MPAWSAPRLAPPASTNAVRLRGSPITGAAFEAVLGPPRVLAVRVGLPEQLGNVVQVELGARGDLADDRHAGGVYVVLRDAGGDQSRRGAQRGLADRKARQRGHRVVGEAAAREQDRARAGLSQYRRRDLGGDDAAQDVDVVSRLQMLDRRGEDVVRGQY